MKPRSSKSLAILLALVAQVNVAQFCLAQDQQATVAERTYNELRKSNDTKTQIMAERWYGAVKLQEWTNKSGKFSTTAKYVEHDLELAWVKLRIITGSGDKRVIKDVTIPLAELSKTCQARVRTINVLSEKVAAALVEETVRAANDAPGHEGQMESEEGAAFHHRAEGDGSDVRGALSETTPVDERRAQSPSVRRGTRPSAPRAAATSGPPLPAHFPALPAMAGPKSSASGPAAPSPITEPKAEPATGGVVRELP